MKKRGPAADALVGLALSLLVLGAYALRASPLERLELKTYDLRSALRQSIDAGGGEIVLVAIDDDSVARLGRWPWPRSLLAELVDAVSRARPKVIGLDVPLYEPERSRGVEELRRLQGLYAEMLRSRGIPDRGGFAAQLSSAAARLDADASLRAALSRAGNVVLPMRFEPAGATREPAPVPAAVSSAALSAQPQDAWAPGTAPLEEGRLVLPEQSLARAALGLGHANAYPDLDGVLRRDQPAVLHRGAFYPSYALALFLRYLGFEPGEARVTPGRAVEVGDTRIPLDERQSMLLTFTGPARSFRYYSAHEVLGGGVPAEALRDRLVLVGPTASGAAEPRATPAARDLPALELTANAVDDMLYHRFLTRPEWAQRAELAAIALAGLVVLLALPRLRVLQGAALCLLLAAGLLGGGAWLFTRGEWLKASYPCALLAAGWGVTALRRLLAAERGAEPAEPVEPGSGPASPKDGSAPAPATPPARTEASPSVRSRLGRYEIERELGRGAMGVVYLGRDPKINRRVAIKTLAPGAGADPAAAQELKERFFREAESAGRLNHPHIVRIFDAGEEGGVCYIAMELLEGHDFTRYASRAGRLPPERVLECVAQVADALDYAHSQGVVHRDVKPANFMLLEDGSVRVTDFGLARPAAFPKGAGTVQGTPAYMSPEAAVGRKTDGRSDIFSLGASLFELLTGEKPFRGGEGIGPLLFQVANDPEPDPSALEPALAPCAARIVHKALQKKPEQRYQRAAEMAADLRACAQAPRASAAEQADPALPPGGA